MVDNEIHAAINKNTKAVIMQNTFGRIGLNFATLDYLRSKKILIIEDCALSIGSEYRDQLLFIW